MLLVLDVGNTNTVVGVYKEKHLLQHWRLTSDRKTGDELAIYLRNLMFFAEIPREDLRGAIISSVVPSLEAAWIQGIESSLGLRVMKVTSSMNLGLTIHVREPRSVGADRLVNAVAGIECYGTPLLLVDFGTAVTLDAVDSSGAYIGGAIAPGLNVSVEALFGKTAKLPRVPLEAPPQAIGKDTMEAIQSGILYGYAGMVDGLVRRMWRELEKETPVVATGGQAGILKNHSETITHVDPWLTLEGLRILYHRNVLPKGSSFRD
ncbi:MAG TPA: type III pantothenate kinase [Synergistaceae bacterium]|nr:type III pantothenate kinase [Synergistaceae bacterium]